MLCGSAERRLLFAIHRSLFRCSSCGLVYAEARREASAGADYDEAYFRGGVYSDYLMDRAAIHRNASRTLAELERLTPGRRLLDVGCAAGFFLEKARSRGWSVHGLELSAYASAYGRERLGLPVENASILSPPTNLPPFDAVTLWDVIEHLDEPGQALAQIRRLLQPHGILALSTGDYGCWLRRLTGRRWRLFDDPTHNFFFDVSTLRRLLTQEGFTVLRVLRRGKWVSLSMILHQVPLHAVRKLGARLSTGRWNPAIYVNLRDVVTVFATPHTRVGGETLYETPGVSENA
jgi:SAM-dependent methyltransferase